MPIYKLIKDGKVVNSILADEVESIRDQYDEIEEFIPDESELAAATRVWSQNDVRSSLTLSEKVVWDNDAAPEVVTAKLEMGSALEEESITEILNFLVTANVISEASKNAILS